MKKRKIYRFVSLFGIMVVVNTIVIGFTFYPLLFPTPYSFPTGITDQLVMESLADKLYEYELQKAKLARFTCIGIVICGSLLGSAFMTQKISEIQEKKVKNERKGN